MSTIINGTSPSVTFSDATTQSTAGLPLTGGTLTGAIVVPTLNATSGALATQNGMNGIAKAWVYFNSAGNIISSFNVSSVTLNSTGVWTVNFTSALPTYYGSVGCNDGNGAGNYVCYSGANYGTRTTTACTVAVVSAGIGVSTANNYWTFFG